jgi:hypothetical protein
MTSMASQTVTTTSTVHSGGTTYSVNTGGSNIGAIGAIGSISIPSIGSNYYINTTGAGGNGGVGIIGSSSTSYYPGGFTLTNPIITTDKRTINLNDLADTLDEIKDKLCILRPKEDLLEKYESLKKAYNHYKMLEKLVYGEKK